MGRFNGNSIINLALSTSFLTHNTKWVLFIKLLTLTRTMVRNEELTFIPIVLKHTVVKLYEKEH